VTRGDLSFKKSDNIMVYGIAAQHCRRTEILLDKNPVLMSKELLNYFSYFIM